MSSRHTFRTASSISLAMTLLLWSGTAVAMLPESPTQCHVRVMHARQHRAAAGPKTCCPGHANASHEPASRTAAAVIPAARPNCCSISEAPAQPRAYLIASSRALELNAQVITLPKIDRSRPALSPAFADSPTYTQSVFAKKADLRI